MSFVINSRFNSNILVVDFITACHQISPSLHNQLCSSKLKPKPVKNCLSYVFLCHQDEIEKQKKKLSSNTHDWYCWECHKAGEVIACEYCPRVFHRKCAHSGTVANGKWKCPARADRHSAAVFARLPYLHTTLTHYHNATTLYARECSSLACRRLPRRPRRLDRHHGYVDLLLLVGLRRRPARGSGRRPRSTLR